MAKKTSKSKKEPLSLDQIKKKWASNTGRNVLAKATETLNKPVKFISTGTLGLDLATHRGGFPMGRIIELWGPEACGKTTTALQTVANAQKEGVNCAYFDAESALDMNYMTKLGVDLDKLWVMDAAESAEVVLSMALDFCESGEIGVVVIDSVPALIPEIIDEKEIGESTVGVRARLLSDALPKIARAAMKNDVMVILINQMRKKIGVMYGSPDAAPGGHAIKHYASLRVKYSSAAKTKEKDDEGIPIASRIKGKIIKNKVGPPFSEFEYSLYYQGGINKEEELIDIASNKKVVDVKGSWYYYGDEKLGQGANNAAAGLMELGLMEEVREKTLQAALPDYEPKNLPPEKADSGGDEDPLDEL